MTYKDNEILTIEIESEEKDLGILFEKNLKSNKHITVTVKRANNCWWVWLKEHFYG